MRESNEAGSESQGRDDHRGLSVSGCPVCGGQASPDLRARAFLGLTDVDHPCSVQRCVVCGTRWLDPFPAPVGAQLYDRAYYESPEEGHLYSQQARQLMPLYAERARRFRALGVTGGLLDVGCGTGEFLLAAREVGIAGQGVELSSYAAGVAEAAGLQVWHGDLDSLPAAPGSFAALHCSHVLEHVLDAHAFLSRVHTLLQPGAPVYFEVPLQFDGVLERIEAMRGRNCAYSAYSIHHHYFFTPRSMRALLTDRGFQVEALTTFLPARRAGRAAGVRKWALQSLLWAADRLASAGDVIAVWGRRAR